MGYDPLRKYVVSLLHFDGSDNSTLFNDATGRGWVVGSGAKINSSGGPFGAGCGYFDGYGGYIDCNAAIIGPSADFCIEFFIKPSTVSVSSSVVDARSVGGAGFLITQPAADPSSLNLYIGDSNTSAYEVQIGSGANTIATAAWTHVAVSRSGSTFRLFIDGLLKNSAIWGGSIAWHSNNFRLGHGIATSAAYFGRLGEFRVTAGAPRRTADFTPPTAPFELRGTLVAGTVQKGDPTTAAKRNVILLRLLDQVVVGVGVSDPDTGTYEIQTDADVDEALLGMAYPDYGQPWAAGQVYALSDRTWYGAPAPLGHWYECEQAGTTGSTEPTWPTDGSTVTDGTVIWRDKGVMERPWAEGPYLAEAV